MTFDEWLADGRRNGWVVGEFCAAHDVAPLTADELNRAEAGDDMFDVCAPSIRVRLPEEMQHDDRT